MGKGRAREKVDGNSAARGIAAWRLAMAIEFSATSFQTISLYEDRGCSERYSSLKMVKEGKFNFDKLRRKFIYNYSICHVRSVLLLSED